MRIVHFDGTQSVESLKAVATVGFFDGVHRGHRHVLQRLVTEARKRRLEAMVVTFGRHPRQVLQQEYIPELLSPHARKMELLEAAGVDCVVVLDFTPAMARLTAREFMLMLKERLGVECLFVGYDNRFGRDRAEGFAQYAAYGRQLGIDVVDTDALTMPGTKVSSSAVRLLIREGNIPMANDCLGYRYSMTGTVVHGDGRGRTLGFPTANIEVVAEQLLPARGVYAVRVWVEGFDESFAGMMNIGRRPTFGLRDVTLEVNIIDFDADIYGSRVRVEYIQRIREERKFSSAQQLIEQLTADRQKVKEVTDYAG